MHIEVQVALNFVISYLYNKLPRRRVNIFGEELEKALKEKFRGHWYPEKPFKGSAFRCFKTGNPVDPVFEIAARESGVPIADILENLPTELAVWADPGEVSYRIGEKGQIKVLYSESSEHGDESSSADREVTKTFNPEAQCFKPIDSLSVGMNNMSLSPKGSSNGSPPTSSSSPTYKGTVNSSPVPGPTGPFALRSQAPLTFTTASFAQTKFGSTKLKTNSKRANSRMSPTEFSNYIKQRAMQQQLHQTHNICNGPIGPIGPSSPSRSLSPNAMSLGIQSDPYYFPNMGLGMYPPQYNGARNLFDSSHFHPDSGNMYPPNGQNKFSSFVDGPNYYGVPQTQSNQMKNVAPNMNGPTNLPNQLNGNNNPAPKSPIASPGGNQDNSKLLDNLNSFYSNSGPYHQLLVAN